MIWNLHTTHAQGTAVGCCELDLGRDGVIADHSVQLSDPPSGKAVNQPDMYSRT